MTTDAIDTSLDRGPAPLESKRATATLPEAAVVLGVPVGLVLGRQLWALFRDGAIPVRPPFTDSRLLATLGAEVVLAIVLVVALRRRDWSLRSAIGRPVALDILRGGGLWIGTYFFVTIVNVGLRVVSSGNPVSAPDASLNGHVGWSVIVAALINPLFEEGLWLGYAIPTLSGRVGLLVAAALSLGLRVGVHWNQGLLALTSVLPVGMVWTAYYLRSKRLWPVIVAHIINNAIGFSAFVGG